jgi:hypothetical protein
MSTEESNSGYIVWGADNTPYGPVELPVLVSWVKDERVTSDTWIFRPRTNEWRKAPDVDELRMFFKGSGRKSAPGSGMQGLSAGALRRIKILASMSEPQLQRFADFVKVQEVPQWQVIVRQGEPGDSMYFVLAGELRVSVDVMGRETILTTLGPGEFFGDISILDKGPRSADVVANSDSTVAKISAADLEELTSQAPELAALFLKGLGRTLTARIRADNKRYGDSVKFARAAE